MEHSENRRADRLDRYWDSVLIGVPAEADAVDSLTRSLIAALAPRSTQQEGAQLRIRQNLTSAARSIEANRSNLEATSPAETRSQPSPPSGRSKWGRYEQWKFPAAAVAAILLAIVAGYLLLTNLDGDEPKTVPAVLAPTATPAPEISATTLLDIVIPHEQLPQGESAGSGFGRMRIPPNSSSTWDPYCCPGPLVHFVVAGSYTISSESPAQVVHLDGSVEDVPALIEVTLVPGEFLLARNEDRITASNRESTETTILNWVLIDDPVGEFSGHILPGWSKIEADVQGPTIYPGSATVKFEVVTFPVGASLVPAPGVTYFALVAPYTMQGTPQSGVGLARIEAGSLENMGNHEIQVYVLTLEQVVPPDWSPGTATAEP